MLKKTRRFAVSAAIGALLVGGGIASLSVGAAASPGPTPSSLTITSSQSCGLQRIGDQFVKCDNLTGAGVRAPSFVRAVTPAVPTVVPTHLTGIQRIGLGDYR